jgi:hypothetical protein
MGLDLCVGLLASIKSEADPEGIAAVEQQFEALNWVLGDAGLSPHLEPASLNGTNVFEAQMWGYGGLHNVRRLAAHLTYRKQLASPRGYVAEAETSDPYLAKFYDAHTQAVLGRPSLIESLLGKKPKAQPFEHLIMHSDCEGYYLPREMDRVVVDRFERVGVGGFVGSSTQLLSECKVLAQLIELPPNLDPEAEELWEAAESPPEQGPLWQRYGIEAFCLARLIRGCEVSIQTGAALTFN